MASSLNVAWPEPALDPEAITVLAAAFDLSPSLSCLSVPLSGSDRTIVVR